jgi:hypothetical protein
MEAGRIFRHRGFCEGGKVYCIGFGVMLVGWSVEDFGRLWSVVWVCCGLVRAFDMTGVRCAGLGEGVTSCRVLEGCLRCWECTDWSLCRLAGVYWG